MLSPHYRAMQIQDVFRHSKVFKVLRAIIAVLGITCSVGSEDFFHLWDQESEFLVLVLFTFFIACQKHQILRHNLVVPSAVLSLICFLGKGVASAGDVSFLSPSILNVSVALISIFGHYIVMELLISASLEVYSTWGKLIESKADIFFQGSSSAWQMQLVMLLCWSPWMILQYPGYFSWDGLNQIAQGVGELSLSAHHPLFITNMYSIIFQIGCILLNASGAILLLVLVQAFLLSYALSDVVHLAQELGLSKLFQILAFLFFAFNPMFACYSTWVVKDVVATSFFVIWLVRVVRCALDSNRGFRLFVSSCVFGALTVLSRNDAIAPVCIAYVALACTHSSRQAKAGYAMLLVVTIAISGLASVAIDFQGKAAPVNVRESLSAPLQMTARYLQEYPNDILEDEREVLTHIIISSDLDDLAAAYDPTLADPVKSQIEFENASSLINYLKTWLSMGVRHPDVYLSSFLQGTIGYWYPFADYHSQGWDGAEALPLNSDYAVYPSGFFEAHGLCGSNLHQELASINRPFASFQEELMRFSAALKELPIISLVFHPGTYFVTLMLCVIWALMNHQLIEFVLIIPLLIKVLICFLSPLSGSVRYFLPVICGCVVAIETCLHKSSDRSLVEERIVS